MRHNTAGYTSGCRCDVCRKAATDAHKKWADERLPELAEYKRNWRKMNKERNAAAQRKWYYSHREQALSDMRQRRFRNLYGITVEQREEMAIRQDGKCAICGIIPNGNKNFHVDHDHNTGKIRQLLCNKCNAHLGWFETQEANVLAYLAKHREME